MNPPADGSLHQHPAFTRSSSLLSQLRQWRGERKQWDGGGEGRDGGFGGGCIGHTNIHTHTPTPTQAHSQTEGGWWRGRGHIGQRSGSLYLCVFVCVCFGVSSQDCMDPYTHTTSTPWAVWVMPVPSQSNAPLLTAWTDTPTMSVCTLMCCVCMYVFLHMVKCVCVCVCVKLWVRQGLSYLKRCR